MANLSDSTPTNFLAKLTAGDQIIQKQVELVREEVNKADQVITKLMGYAQLTEGRLDKLIKLSFIKSL